MTSEHAEELTALAVMELELDRLVAEKVASARKAGLSWDDIATACGVSRPSAWRRWKDVVDDPHGTRPARRDAARLVLTEQASATAHQLADELASRLVNRPDDRPWSAAVRTALDRMSRKYDVVQRGPMEMEYRVRGTRLQITCLEPTSAGPGGVSAVTAPDPGLSVCGEAQARTAHLTSDGLIPAGGEKLVAIVLQFITAQFDQHAR